MYGGGSESDAAEFDSLRSSEVVVGFSKSALLDVMLLDSIGESRP